MLSDYLRADNDEKLNTVWSHLFILTEAKELSGCLSPKTHLKISLSS